MAHRSRPRVAAFVLFGLLAVAAGCSASSSSGGTGSDASAPDASLDAPKQDTGASCDIPECIRPVNCRLSCGGPIMSSSCCPCPPPTFDDLCCAHDACAP